MSLNFCGCGCGKQVTKEGNKWVHGHNPSWIKGLGLGDARVEQIAAKKRGTHPSDASREQMRRTHLKNFKIGKEKVSEERRKEVGKFMKGNSYALGRCPDEEERRVLSKSHKGIEPWNKHLTAATDERVRLRAEKMIKAMEKGNLKAVWWNTSIEMKVEDQLLDQGFMTERNRYIKGVGFIDRFLTDYENIIIECDGDYYHCNSKVGGPSGRGWKANDYNERIHMFARDVWEQDRVKTEKATKLGYTVFRFWETDINRDVEGCVAKIVEHISKLDKANH